MKILHIGKFFPPFAGGIEHFLADLLAAQWAQGDSAYALVHAHHRHWHPWPPVQPEAPPYPYIYRAPCYGRILYAPVSPHFPWWLARTLRQVEPHVLHLHMPNTSALWALLSPAARRLPWVVHWHADVSAALLDKRLTPAYRLYRPWEQALLKHSRIIVATSPPYLDASASLRPWRDKCEIVPLGIDPQRLPNATASQCHSAEARWGKNVLRVLHIGRLTYYKGQATLIRAAAECKGIKVIIVGEGELRPRLQKLITQLGVDDKVELTGYCDAATIAALLHTCDCFCLPSLDRAEAFGVVLMEAMAQGKALVTSAIEGSGVGWVAAGCGLSVPVADIHALAAALMRLRDDPALRQNLGAHGATRFADDFHIERVATQLQSVYQRL
jgi:glycosyltransferase involved in cell wall biosynthesis